MKASIKNALEMIYVVGMIIALVIFLLIGKMGFYDTYITNEFKDSAIYKSVTEQKGK